MSQVHIIENSRLRVTVSSHGAELCSIYDKKAEREVIWNADPSCWNRHAPVLFPFVGKALSVTACLPTRKAAGSTHLIFNWKSCIN